MPGSNGQVPHTGNGNLKTLRKDTRDSIEKLRHLTKGKRVLQIRNDKDALDDLYLKNLDEARASIQSFMEELDTTNLDKKLSTLLRAMERMSQTIHDTVPKGKTIRSSAVSELIRTHKQFFDVLMN